MNMDMDMDMDMDMEFTYNRAEMRCNSYNTSYNVE